MIHGFDLINLNTSLSARCFSSTTESPAILMFFTVLRFRFTPIKNTEIGFNTFSRNVSIRLLLRMCSRFITKPSGLQTRRISRSAATGFGMEQSTKVVMT